MMTRLLGWMACAGAVVLLVVAMVTGTAPASAAAGVSVTGVRVTGAVVRLPVVPGRPAAGYFTLTASSVPVELTAVTGPSARVELHDMRMTGGVMRMDKLPSVRVAAGATATFAPGAAHLMVFDLPTTLRPGMTLPLTFVFADGSRVPVAAAVIAGTAPLPASHGAR